MAAGKEIKRLRGSVSAERVAHLIGVPSGRLRKWEERDTDPKDTGDIRAVEIFFGCRLADLKNLEYVEWRPRNPTPGNNEPSDLLNRYVQTLERQVAEKDTVVREVNERLIAIEKSLSEAKRNQQVMYSVQAAFQEVVLPLLAGPRRKAIEKEVAEKAVALLEKYQREGF